MTINIDDRRRGPHAVSVLPVAQGKSSESELLDIERFVRMCQRQAKLVAVCALVGALAGLAYLLTTPRTYTASASALIDESLSRVGEEQVQIPLTLEKDSAVLSQVEILTSSRLAGKVVDNLKLSENEEFMNPPTSLLGAVTGMARGTFGLLRGGGSQGSSADTGQGRRQLAIETLQKNLSAHRLGQTYVVEINYKSHDPKMAADIANAYASAYLANQLDASFDAAERAALWLRERIEGLRVELLNASRAVEEYRARHGLASSQGELLSERRLAELTTQLIEAQSDTAKAQALYDQFVVIVESGSESAAANPAITSGQLPTSDIAVLKTRYVNVARREQEIAGSFGKDHPQAVRLQREEAELTKAIFAEVKRMTDSYRNDLDVAKTREAALRQTIEDARGANAAAGAATVELQELQQKADALKSLYTSSLQRYEQTQQQQTFPIGKVRLISDAVAPRAASAPRTSIVLGLGLILGCLAGCVIGALREFNERFFRTGDDVRETLGAKFLGYLPDFGSKAPASRAAANKPFSASGDAAAPDSAPATGEPSAPSSLYAETLRSIRLAADVVLQGSPSKVIGIVSMLPDEGKSTTAANLAHMLASSNASTLLIDADLRNPGLSALVAPEAMSGLIDAVVSPAEWRRFLKKDRRSGLAMLPSVASERLQHSSELLGSPGMRQIIEDARREFSYIIIDLPPLGAVVDARSVEPQIDGFIFIAEWGKTPRKMVRDELANEPALANKLLGVALTKVDVAALRKFAKMGATEEHMHRYADYHNGGTSRRDAEAA